MLHRNRWKFRGWTDCAIALVSFAAGSLVTGRMALTLKPAVNHEEPASRLTAEVIKNLRAESGVAYVRLGAILTLLAAPEPAPKFSAALKGSRRVGHRAWLGLEQSGALQFAPLSPVLKIRPRPPKGRSLRGAVAISSCTTGAELVRIAASASTKL